MNKQEFNLNTSHVTVNPKDSMHYPLIKRNLNTSHVTVNLDLIRFIE